MSILGSTTTYDLYDNIDDIKGRQGIFYWNIAERVVEDEIVRLDVKAYRSATRPSHLCRHF